MARPAIVPTTEERSFSIEELFISTTDHKGIILTGNKVFARVSGWAPAELIGQPHNILRHPDMPRVVFKLLWDEIQAGRPIVAYVKNLARTGGSYWVIASVVPTGSGYLSVRFKPSSAIFPVVQGLYAQLRAVEAEIEDADGTRAEAMSASGAALGAALQTLGYGSYQDFMLTFVPAELKSRDAGMASPDLSRDESAVADANPETDLGEIGRDVAVVGRFLHDEFSQLDQFVALGETLVGKAEFVRDLAKNVRLISQNVSISSRRRESAGRPLAVVGDTIRDLADRVGGLTVGLTERIHNLSAALRHQAFRISIARLQAQTAAAFVDEMGAPPSSGTAEPVLVGSACGSIAALTQYLAEESAALFGAYREIGGTLRLVSGEASQLRDLLKTLDMVRLTGRVEVSRLKDNGEFQVLFDTIEKELAAATTQLGELAVAMASIAEATARGSARERDLLARLAQAGEAVQRIEQLERA